MMMMRVASFFFLLPLLAGLAAVSSTNAAAGGTVIRMQVSHADAGRGLSQRELLQRMALRSSSRVARLLSGGSSSAASAPVTPGHPTPEYLVHLGIGTPPSPPQPVQLTLDTGSDLIWTQCQPCTSAAGGGTCFRQALPYFDPSASVLLPCDSPACQDPLLQPSSCLNQTTCVYSYSYGDNSTTTGVLVADTFVFHSGGGGGGETTTAVPDLSFGCGVNNSGIFTSNETGIAGFGRGNLSLPSQLKVDNFSYCFTNITGSTPSPVLLGLPPPASLVVASSAAAVQTTPLIRSSFNPSLYYLGLTSITVGSTTLPVPASAFALNGGDGSGGTFIDSGTSITSLPPDVFGLLSDAFASQLKTAPVAVTSLPGFPCFPVSSTTATVPTLELEFDGGATLELPPENYVIEQEENGESYVCIAIQSSGVNMTVIGNYQQQNMYVIYDLAGETLSFVPANCDMV